MLKKLFLLPIILFSSCFLKAQSEAIADSIWRDIEIEDIVVTAQYAPTDSKNAIYEVKVIKALEIEKQGQNNLAEVLSNQLNIRVSTDPILGNGLKIQGIGGENIQILLDGVPVIGRVNGNIDLSQIQLSQIDRIEIIEGALSAQYGSNASGGVINIISKKSQLAPFSFESANQYESVGIWNNSISFGLKLGNFFASANGSRINYQFAPVDSLRLNETIELPSGETYRTKVNPWNPKLQYGFNGMLRYRFNDSFNITYQYRYFDELLSNYGEVRRPQFKPYSFDETFSTIRKDHSLNIDAYLGSKFYLNSTTAYNQYDRLKEATRLDFENDSTSLVPGGQDTSNFTALLQRSILSTVSNRSFNGQFGIEILHETGTGQRIVDSTSTSVNTSSLTNYSAWASLLYQAFEKSVAVQANLRYGYNTKYDHPLIPSINANWKINKKWDVKLNFAYGFRAPSLKELHYNFIDINHNIVGNLDLKAENSKNASFLISYNTKIQNRQQLSVSSKLFYNTIKNQIVLAEYEPAKYNYQNLDNFKTHGLNLQLEYRWDNVLKIKSGFVFTRFYNYFSEDFDADNYTNLPELQNELYYNIPFIKTDFVFTHRYIGRQIQYYENDEGELEQGIVDAYNLMNATLSRGFWKNRIFLAFGVKNILDLESVPFVGQSSGTHSGSGNNQLISWGRTYFVRLNFSWN